MRKACANGRNNSQHCWPNNFESCCVRLHVSKRLTVFKLCATIPNNMQQGDVTSHDGGSCWPTMLRPFERSYEKSERAILVRL